MTENLLEENGMYNYSSYYGKEKKDKTRPIFTMVGTDMPKINSAPLSAMDTFKSETGVVVTFQRKEILDHVRQGKMKPVLGTELSAIAKKEPKESKKAAKS